jgi:hypothetical protein
MDTVTITTSDRIFTSAERLIGQATDTLNACGALGSVGLRVVSPSGEGAVFLDARRGWGSKIPSDPYPDFHGAGFDGMAAAARRVCAAAWIAEVDHRIAA